jgi:hypothetical protein
MTFRDPASLAGELVRLASDPAALAALRAQAGAAHDPSFGRAWAAEVAPVLLGGVA